MQHALRLSQTEGARPFLWCGAAQPQPPRVTRHKTHGTARVPGGKRRQPLPVAGVRPKGTLEAVRCSARLCEKSFFQNAV
jgi:hypothetical protein